MDRAGWFLILLIPVIPCSSAKAPPIGPLEAELIGRWVLQGTLAGKQTTHDLDAQWVLNREYVQLHEISREKTPDGLPQYEAIIYIGWDENRHEYACLWLDSTSGAGLSGTGIGHAKPEANKIPFIFTFRGDHTFQNTFTYGRNTDSWDWLLEDHDAGKIELFGRVRLTRSATPSVSP